MSLHFDSLVVDPLENNVYFLHDGSECLVIDAASNAELIDAYAKEHNLNITQILTTHRHYDHVGALKDLVALTGARTYASAIEAEQYPVYPDIALHDGDTIRIGSHECSVLIISGHTEGGACLVADIGGVTHIFVGDCLFPGGVGKTNSAEEFTQLLSGVEEKLFNSFDDSTVILPGHGKATTLGAERPFLPQWQARGW